MSESIQFRKERSIPDYELMRTLNLFTEEEIRNLKNKRESFEYSIQGLQKSEYNYKDYIKYEERLLLQIQEKCKNHEITTTELQEASVNRIKGIYKKSLNQFKESWDLWTNYYKFLEENKQPESCEVINNMIKFFPKEEMLYIKAADQYLKLNDSQNAKKVLERGIEKHNSCPDIYTHYIALLFNHIADDKNKSLLVREAKIVLGKAEKHITDVKFFIDLLIFVQDIEFTDDFQDKIISTLLDKFPQKEETYDILAKRHLDGLIYEPKSDSINLTTARRSSDAKKNLQYCVKVYETACDTLNSVKMWALYLEKLASLNSNTDAADQLKPSKRHLLGNALKKCHEAGKMSEEFYLLYINLLIEDVKKNQGSKKEKLKKAEENFVSVIESALEKYACSSRLWMAYLKFGIHNDDKIATDKIFDKAIKSVRGPQSLPLWRLMFQFYLTIEAHQCEHVLQLYKKAINDGHQCVANFYKPELIAYVNDFKGLVSARKLYNEIFKNAKACLELHYKMIELETIVAGKDVKHIRTCYENAIAQFGSESPEVWIDFIKFERSKGEPKNESSLVNRAKSILSTDKVTDFETAYDLYKLEIDRISQKGHQAEVIRTETTETESMAEDSD